METNEKVLVVDDEREMVSTLQLRFEATTPWNVITAYDGYQGLEKARQEKPGLILLDIAMPGLSGFQVCRELKGVAETSLIPIILLTAMSQNSDRYWGKKMGADAYITKPFEFDTLIGRMKELMNRHEQRCS